MKQYRLGPPIFEDHGSYKVRLADDVRKCVAYLGTSGGGEFDPMGTGFFLAYGDPQVCYLITAAHVAKQLGDDHFVIRMNDKTGLAREEEINNPIWHKHPDPTVDLAVLEYMPPGWADWLCWPGFAIATENKLLEKDIGAGDLVNIVGVYKLLHGKNRNLPIVHTGHIALMAQDEPIPTDDWNAIDPKKAPPIDVKGYLIEISTLPGVSGAPVFARRSLQIGIGGSNNPDRNHEDAIKSWSYGTVWLLGVWQGSWVESPTALVRGIHGLGQGPIRVSLSMGIAIPATQLIEILDGEDLATKRRKAKEKKQKAQAVQLESGKEA